MFVFDGDYIDQDVKIISDAIVNEQPGASVGTFRYQERLPLAG